MPLPALLTYQIIIRELINCDISFYTEKTDDDYQISHPKIDFENFPTITFPVEKSKNHFWNGIFYIHAKSEQLRKHDVFVKLIGNLIHQKETHHNLIEIELKITSVQLKKLNLATKITWQVDEQ